MATAKTGPRCVTSSSSKEYNDYREKVYDHADHASRGGEHVACFYNTWAGRYNELHLTGGWCAPTNLAAIASDVISNKTARILDAASGTGMVGAELKGLSFTCIDALDPSQDSLDKSKEQQLYTEYICDTLDEHQTNIPDNHYDAVVMCGAFGVPGHVSDACFPELIRITKPGGVIMFTVGENVLDQCDEKMQASIEALSQEGQWDVVEYRWMPYIINEGKNEKAKVPILRVLKK